MRLACTIYRRYTGDGHRKYTHRRIKKRPANHTRFYTTLTDAIT